MAAATTPRARACARTPRRSGAAARGRHARRRRHRPCGRRRPARAPATSGRNPPSPRRRRGGGACRPACARRTAPGAPQAGEAVGGDEAQRHQLGQRLLELGAQQAAMLQQLVEEGGAVGGNEIDDSLRLGAGPRAGVGRLGHRPPQRGMAARQQRDRGRAHRRRPPRRGARAQPQPGGMARQAARVEPRRTIVLQPRRQDVAFPGGGRRAEAFELADDGVERSRALDLGVGRDPLPAEQEAQEVAGRHGFDLRPQPLDRVAVDARQQPALAPFVDRRVRREAAAQGKAFGLERRQRRGKSPRAAGQAARRARPQSPVPGLRAGRARSRPAPRRATIPCRRRPAR